MKFQRLIDQDLGSGGDGEGDLEGSDFSKGTEKVHRKAWKGASSVFALWGLGVGAVIQGDFFGWNLGLGAGGFYGMLVATVIATLTYIAVAFCLAEMSSMIPSAEGAFAFSRNALGPWGGYLCGLAEALEYVLLPAVLVVGLGGYTVAILGTDSKWQPLYWLVYYVLFVGLNIHGTVASMRFSVVVVLLSLLSLCFMYVSSLVVISSGGDITPNLLNIPPDKGASLYFPHGFWGIVAALPFAMWFFVAVEELPVAAEDVKDPTRDIPRALVFAIFTLIIFAFLTLFLSTAIIPGASGLQAVDDPLFVTLRAIFGRSSAVVVLLPIIALLGMTASFHSIIFASGRQLFSLARAGVFPQFLIRTRSKKKTPWVAFVTAGIVGYVVAVVVFFADQHGHAMSILLQMAMLCTLISYCFSMVSFVVLRYRRSGKAHARPFRSPFGVPAAFFAFIVVFGVFIYLLVDRATLVGAWATLGAYLLGFLYFLLFGRRRLLNRESARLWAVQAMQYVEFRDDTADESPPAILE